MKQHTISLVTVCMNRLHHLQQTLPRNISDNEAYEHLEFVVLDYNSTDGLGKWINSHMGAYLENGRLQYYHTLEPACYHPAHSRNMAFLLSKGQLVCNIDADNFSGGHFAAYLNKQFCENEKSVLITFGGSRQLAPKDAYGRVCITRNDFIAVNGYDECIDQYCGEDIDLAKRIMQLGRETVVIEEEAFLHTIAHDDAERIREMPLLKTIAACYLMPEANGFSRVLFLFFNRRFILVTLRGHGQRTTPGWQDAVDEGQYVQEAGRLQLFFEQDFSWELFSGASGQMLSFSPDKPTTIFYQVTAEESLSSWAIQYMLRQIRARHYEKRVVNASGFGHGTVFHNFDYAHSLPVSPAINSVTNE
jgi:hypothetical protein